MTRALVLVDVQRDFLAEPGLFPPARECVAAAARLLEACRKHGVPVVHVWLTVKGDLSNAMPHRRAPGATLCIEGTEGHRTPESLEPAANEIVVPKSGFSGFAETVLRDHLAALGAKSLILAGVHGHACIRQTAIDALDRGFAVEVARDAVASRDPLHAEISRSYLAERGVVYAGVDEIIDRLPGSEPSPRTPVVEGLERCASAVEAAVQARAAWRATEPAERADRLSRLLPVLETCTEELARAITAEMGKPIRFARFEIERCIALVRAVASRRDEALEGPVEPGVSLRRSPLGTVAILTPWNHPLAIAVGKIAPALFYGNTVVWKPSPESARVAHALMRRWREVGLGDELQLADGGSACGEALMAHPDIDAVSITGGPGAGFTARAICARRGIPLQAELGGNNAAIVWEDADLDLAAEAIVAGAFGGAGQRCTANRRAIVAAPVAEALLERVVRETRALVLGDPNAEETAVGPVVSAGHASRIFAMLARAEADGARVLTPQPAPPGFADRFLAPTIVTGAEPGSEIVQRESFGPVLVVQVARSWDEAIALCNGVAEGLVAALFSRSETRRRDFLDRAEAGVLKLDTATADVGVLAPFGGWKASGFGPPEHGEANREFYTRAQAIYRR